LPAIACRAEADIDDMKRLALDPASDSRERQVERRRFLAGGERARKTTSSDLPSDRAPTLAPRPQALASAIGAKGIPEQVQPTGGSGVALLTVTSKPPRSSR
jgi:hypothetical protein